METASQVPAMALTETKSSVRWKIFLMMLMLISVNYANRASLSAAMPLITKEFNISPTVQGLLLSPFFLTYALMQTPGGMLAGRFGLRVVIAGATLSWGFFQSIAALCTGWVPLLITHLGLGVTEAPIYPAGGRLNAIWMTQNEHGHGATLFNGGAPLGTALGALIIAGLIAEFNSWRTPFVVAGVGTMAAGLFAWRYIRNHPHEYPSVNNAETSCIEEAYAADRAAEPAALSGNVLNFFKYRSVWGTFFDWICFNALFCGLLTWMPTYLSKVHGPDIKEMGSTVFTMFSSDFVGEMVGGWIVDKWMATGAPHACVLRALFGITSVLAMIAIYTVARFKDPVVVVAPLSTALFLLHWCGLFWCVPSALDARKRIGFLGGTMDLDSNFAGAGMPIIVGLIVQATGLYDMALMLFTATGAGLFICSALLVDYSEKLPI